MLKEMLKEILKEHLKTHRSIILANGFVFLLFLSFFIYIKVDLGLGASGIKTRAIKHLFDESVHREIYFGLLTELSELLWTIPVIVCVFSFVVLKQVQARQRMRGFILSSALIIGMFLVDDVLRLTLFLNSHMGIPKAVMYLLYSITVMLYTIRYRSIIQATTYFPLVIGVVFIVISAAVDIINIPNTPGRIGPLFLEDGSKFIGVFNIALYFWQLCHQEIMELVKPRSTAMR